MLFSRSKVLGINARNLLYIRPYNKSKAIKLADDKLKTKQFLAARDIPVPKLYAVIKDVKELEKFNLAVLPQAFVIKPNKGFGGEGIIPIKSKEGKNFLTVSHKIISKPEIDDHLRDILDGRFSISGVSDYAFMEQLIIADERVGNYSYAGLPDIRVVVHNLIPIMAMLRLPTKESEGKANLHMGAVGVGIDIAKGTATHMVHHNKIVEELPGGLGKIRGMKIPYWDEILHIASKVQLATNLGYMAADICLDKTVGPTLLEINARAGLSVQMANLAPLRQRLERIEGIQVTSPIKGVRMAKDLFGNVVEKEIKNLSGKQVIGTQEDIAIILKDGTIHLKAKIDTTRETSEVDKKFAKENQLLDSPEEYDKEKQKLKLKFSIKKTRTQTIANLTDLQTSEHKIIIGRRDLKNFLIDVNLDPKTKNTSIETQKQPSKTLNHRYIDQRLIAIEKKLKLLSQLKPENLESEKEKFFKSTKYNPKFTYRKLKFNPTELQKELQKIHTDDSPLGHLFNAKKTEISLKIDLLQTIGQENFTKNSEKLYGTPTAEEIKDCKKVLNAMPIKVRDHTTLNAEEIKERFEEIFKIYSLSDWKVRLRKSMVSNCTVGKHKCLNLRRDAKMSAKKVKALIIHEIETHILTAENGKRQPYELLNYGLANYLITQEGLAVYNTHTQLNTNFKNNRAAHSLILGIHYAKTHSFRATYNYLIQTCKLKKKQAFRITTKIKRGLTDTSAKGAFTKDLLYYRGYHQILKFLEQGGKLNELYLGKINHHDLETLKKIPEIKKPEILPKWLK